MNLKNKTFIILLVAIFTIGISYSAFSWSEPTGTMPSDYRIPINTSEENQDVDVDKAKVGNLNSDLLDGYDSSELLAAMNGGGSFYNPKCQAMNTSWSSLGCSPINCADGFIDLGTGCVVTGVYSRSLVGYCERYCYKE